MTTTAAMITLMRAAVVSTTGATAMASDHLLTERIPASGIRYQMRALAVEVKSPDSAAPRAQVFVKLDVHRRLGTSEAERTYTEGSMQTWVDAMVQPAYWRAISVDVVEVTDSPQVALNDVRRVGDVVSFTLTVALEYRT